MEDHGDKQNETGKNPGVIHDHPPKNARRTKLQKTIKPKAVNKKGTWQGRDWVTFPARRTTIS